VGFFRDPKRGKAVHISKCLELAILLEVSAYKPGNVTFVSGFQGTRVEHFLASAVAARGSFEWAAARGTNVLHRKLAVTEIGMGQLIKDCVTEITRWQKGGNTLLGTVLLFVPIAVAAGMTPTKDHYDFDLSPLRDNVKLAIESTTSEDAINVYQAIEIAKPSGLNDAPDLDVKSPSSKERLLKDNVSLLEVFKIAANYDDICSEWVHNYTITFDMAYPYLMKQLKSKILNDAIVYTFLKILSTHPDSFIARKGGVEKASEISADAKKLLEFGSLETEEGRRLLAGFDKKLRESGNRLNPGTTADLTSAALALCTLNGFRP
jgi:triphosphoribosyl-dephospho-CoA synthase